jgi:alpha-1,4-digalacturonate transport system substrate-binding protein
MKAVTMVTRILQNPVSALVTAMFILPAAVHGAEIRVMCYQDGVECDVVAEQAKRFEAQNAGTKVVIDVVPYKTIVEQLPVQLAAGQGPDIARVTDLGGLSKYYLDISTHVKDKSYWEGNFGATLPWLRPTPGDTGFYGFMSQLTMTGPYVNKTLFEQAKVALPGPKATWDEWVEATRKVAKANQLPAAMAWDRSGHRFAGPAISCTKLGTARHGLHQRHSQLRGLGRFLCTAA